MLPSFSRPPTYEQLTQAFQTLLFDVRSPLTAVAGYADLAEMLITQGEFDREQALHFVQHIKRAAQTANRIVTNYHEILRAAQGRPPSEDVAQNGPSLE